MKGDFSRFTFNAKNHYAGVRTQQGRVQLDADWNEQMEILEYFQRILALDFIGGSGAPATENISGFKIKESPDSVKNGFLISNGRYYINGLMYEQSVENLSYQDQYPFSCLPEQEGLYVAYLDMWQETITAIEDPNMLDPALNGLDTIVRLKNIACVRLLKMDQDSYPNFYAAFPSQQENQNPHWAVLANHSKGRLKAKKLNNTALLQNQLYRIEIHEGHTFDPIKAAWIPPKKITFKWSRNNAALATRVKTIEAKEQRFLITLMPQAGLNSLDLGIPHYIELTVWAQPKDNQHIAPLSNLLRQGPNVHQVSKSLLLPFDKIEDLQISIKADTLSKNEEEVLEKISKAINEETLKGVTFFIVARFWDCGAQEIKENEYVDIENGLQIQFSNSTKNGQGPIYESGNYWLIPTRSNTNNIVGPEETAIPPQGIIHHYAPLSLISREKDGAWRIKEGYDGRKVFSPLADIIKDLPNLNPLKNIIGRINEKVTKLQEKQQEMQKENDKMQQKQTNEMASLNKNINKIEQNLSERFHYIFKCVMREHIVNFNFIYNLSYDSNSNAKVFLDANDISQDVYLNNYNGTKYQKWRFVPVNKTYKAYKDNEYFYILNEKTNHRLIWKDGKLDKVPMDKSSTNLQHWAIQPIFISGDDTHFLIMNRAEGKALAFKDGVIGLHNKNINNKHQLWVPNVSQPSWSKS